MTDAEHQELGLLAKAVIVVAAILFVSGALWHGISPKVAEQFWHDLVERPDGPMRFRFVLQPLMAAIVGSAMVLRTLDPAARHTSQQCWAIRGNAQDGCGRD